MKNLRVPLLLLASTTLVLSACAGFQTSNNSDESNTNEDGKTVVDFWSFWGSEIRRPVIDKIVADFNASHNQKQPPKNISGAVSLFYETVAVFFSFLICLLRSWPQAASMSAPCSWRTPQLMPFFFNASKKAEIASGVLC